MAVVAFLLALVGVLVYPATRYRMFAVAMKAGGGLQPVEWRQLLRLMRPYSGTSFEQLASSGNPYFAIHNPLRSEEDRARGKEIFGRQCTQCHGNSALGGQGPALVGRQLRHGDSDWALFQTIRGGAEGTGMLPSRLPDDDVWRVITHLRGLIDEGRESIAGTEASTRGPIRETTYALLRAASGEPGDWLLPSGSYDSHRFSQDRQIDRGNVWQLGATWVHQFGTAGDDVESIPIVSDGWMYVTLTTGTVMALDAEAGKPIWTYTRTPPPDVVVCCRQNRGVAVSGNRVYVGTLDAHLLALDASTGKLVWDQTIANYREGYAITSAPLALDHLIVTGIAGGDFATRGFISGHDPDTGTLRWRFNTIPGPGEPGNATWGGNSWQTGGVATWMTGSFDPELNLIYWGTGNPAPDFNAAYRPGANLYSNSVVALDAASGKLVWHFQFTPGDDHDWDSVQTPILINAREGDAVVRLLAVANRNGFFYVLDRTTGKFLRAQPYVKQTWATGLTAEGQPIKNPDATLSPRGTMTWPALFGGTTASKAAYSPMSGLYYVPAIERGGMFFVNEKPPERRPREQFWGGNAVPVDDAPQYNVLRAIDPATATVRWEHPRPRRDGYGGEMGGLLATAGGLVFGGDVSDFLALDADTGKLLWSFASGGEIRAAPVTYRVGGRQYIAVAAGDVLLAFALPVRDAPGPAATGKSPR